ncbi:uncharacterized protein LOC144151433 [Haemaphysalis longicornis]
MSCTEVMYQPYSPYFPYHQRAAAAAAASCPAGAASAGIAAAQAACLDYKRFVSPKMQDLLAGGAGMAASPASLPGPLQSLGPQRTSSASHHSSRNHHHHHSNTASSSSNNNGNGAPPGSSGRSSSSSSSCAVASSPSTPLARSPDRDDSGQPNKARASGTPGSSTSVAGGHGAASVSSTGAPSPSAAASASSAGARDTQFLSANCVVFTYYSGDISAVVDEHFSRALSEPSAYDGTSSCKAGGAQLKDAPPMSQRNFPASFWNCHQSPTGTSPGHGMGGGASVSMSGPVDLYTGGEAHHPYHSHHAHHHASAANAAALHASLQSDPWHYALTAPQAGPYRSTAMHELAYSAAGGAAHRFGAAAAAQQYGSLLLQPRSSRLGSVSATCTALDKSDAWAAASPAARYHHDQLAAAAGHHVVDASSYQAAAHHYGPMGAAAAAAMTGLDGQVQESGKDLYWF